MIIELTLKDPDGVGNTIQELVESQVQEMKDNGVDEELINKDLIRERIQASLKPWVQWDEYVSIRIDTEKNTAEVLRNII